MTAPVLTPTAQQQAILDAAATGEDVKIIAGAGSGKSSTLRLIAMDMERRGQTGIYIIAFNTAVA